MAHFKIDHLTSDEIVSSMLDLCEATRCYIAAKLVESDLFRFAKYHCRRTVVGSHLMNSDSLHEFSDGSFMHIHDAGYDIITDTADLEMCDWNAKGIDHKSAIYIYAISQGWAEAIR